MTANSTSASWGNAIKLCRTQRDMSQSDLAQASGISISYISLLERGKRDPNLSTMEQIANTLNVPITIIAFYAVDQDKITEVSPELAEKLSFAMLQLIKEVKS